jgi:uncharacterized protein YjbI with pentapeptide repeats
LPSFFETTKMSWFPAVIGRSVFHVLLALHPSSPAADPAVTAAWIAAGVSFLTLLVTTGMQFFGIRRVSRDTTSVVHDQLDLQREQLDRTLAEERLRTLNERFATAADRLGADTSAAVRMAAVYAMAGLADDWTENRQTCVDVLCAYLRMPYAPDPGDDAQPSERLLFAADRQVRHTVIRVIAEHLRPNALVSWQGLDFDFTGAQFDGGDFSWAMFSGGNVSFRQAQFSRGHVHFRSVVFSGSRVSFLGAEFSGGKVTFDASEFSGGHVIFADARFCGGTVSFFAARFTGGKVTLLGAEFSSGTVSFSGARFEGANLGFMNSKFTGGHVSFANASLTAGQVAFRRVEFSGGLVSFVGAQLFGGTLRFDDTDFSGGAVDFHGAKLHRGYITFGGARFSGSRVEFVSAAFSGAKVSFNDAKFSGGMIDLRAPADWSHPPSFPNSERPGTALHLPDAWDPHAQKPGTEPIESTSQ